MPAVQKVADSNRCNYPSIWHNISYETLKLYGAAESFKFELHRHVGLLISIHFVCLNGDIIQLALIWIPFQSVLCEDFKTFHVLGFHGRSCPV